jgi:hypothetical protein
MEFSSDSSMGSESEVEITEASGPQTATGPRRKTRRTVKKIPLSKAGLTVAECATRSSTPRGAGKVRGASVPPDTGEVGLAAASLQIEKKEEAPQDLSHMRVEETPPRTGLRAKAAAPLRPSFTLRRSGG